MTKRKWFALVAGLVALSAVAFYGYQRYSRGGSAARGELLAMLPADADTVLFVDLTELRTAPFVTQLYAWAPQPQPDEDYAQFLKETGFNYERDLDKLAVAFKKSGQDSTFLALADGRFDQQRISALARKSGVVERRDRHEMFAIPANAGKKSFYFTFLRSNRIALSDNSNLGSVLSGKARNDSGAEWRSRFERLSGSPVFAVMREDAAPGSTLSGQAPGGFRSPQLSALLDQLQWITIAGKPDNDRLRIVMEGECTSEETSRQLADLLKGVLILADTGLNDTKTRQQLDPALREAYLALLRSAEVSKLDRGETKSVRLTFEITSGFLESARRATTAPPNAAPAKPLPGSAARSKKGHT